MFSNPPVAQIVHVDKRLDLPEAVDLIHKAKKETDLKIISNMTHYAGDLDGWERLARSLVDAGADALELNFCCGNLQSTAEWLGQKIENVNAEGGTISKRDPEEVATPIVRTLKKALGVPVIPKMVPPPDEYKRFCGVMETAGADAINPNCSGPLSAPSLYVYEGGKPAYPSLEKTSFGGTVGPARKYNTYWSAFIASREVNIPVISTGGLGEWKDAVEVMMWGASALGVCTAVMWYGWDVVTSMVDGIEKFMGEAGYARTSDFVGCAQKYVISSDKLITPENYHQVVAVVDTEKCIGCGKCEKPGHCEAITMVNRKAVVDNSLCVGCHICASLCPVQAISYQRVG